METAPQIEGLKPLLALSVDEGLFLIVAASASLDEVQSFARFEAEPLPRFVSQSSYFTAQRTKTGPIVYTAFLPWIAAKAGALQLGCITVSGRKPLFSVNSLAYKDLRSDTVAELRTRFGRILLSAVDSILPATHPFRKDLQPELKAVAPKSRVQCVLDGVIEGLAHGWAYDPGQPAKALNVEVLHEGQVVGRGLADQYRDDLEHSGIGDGHHHFRLKLSYELFDGNPHSLSVRVLGAGSDGPASLPIACNFDFGQPVPPDLITRVDTLVLAELLGRNAKVGNDTAMQNLLQAIGNCCLQQETGMLEEARSGYARLIKIVGPNALCQCKIAETWLLDQQPEQALEAYKAAIQLDPEFARAHLGMGNVLRMQGQALQAQAAYRTAVACAPELQAARLNLASVETDALTESAAQMVEAGDKPGAIAMLRALLFERPEHEAAAKQLYLLLREPRMNPRGGPERRTEAIEQADRASRLLDAMLDEAEHRLATTAQAKS